MIEMVLKHKRPDGVVSPLSEFKTLQRFCFDNILVNFKSHFFIIKQIN